MTPPSNLLNATPFLATYLDGSAATLSLARLTIRQLYTFAQHLAGERIPELIALCTSKPTDWIDTLTDESYAALVNTCIELNFTRASVIAKNDPTLAAHLIPFAQRVQTLVILGASLGLKLSDKSPAPASPESGGETGSAASTSPQGDSTPSSPSIAA